VTKSSANSYCIEVGEIKKLADATKGDNQLLLRLALIAQATTAILNSSPDKIADKTGKKSKDPPHPGQCTVACVGRLFFEGADSCSTFRRENCKDVKFPDGCDTIVIYRENI